MATKTINNTFSSRVENGTTLSGAEALSVENVQQPDQTISAGTEEQTALMAFKDSQMQSMLLRSDQDVKAEFLGIRYAILATAIAGPDTITHTGDLEQELAEGDIVRVQGTVGDDGYYLIQTVAELIGVTTITLAGGQILPAGGGGAVGTVARVCSHADLGYAYDIGALGGTLTLATGVIDMPLNLTDKFAAGDIITMRGSTGNNGIWRIVSVTLAGLGTEIVVQDVNDAGLLVDNTNDGDFQLVKTAFVLLANIPLLWTIASGIQNPFQNPVWDPQRAGAPENDFNADRGDVAFCMVNNAGALSAEFQAIISTNAII